MDDGDRLSRRQLLRRGGAAAGSITGLALAGLVGFDLPHSRAGTSAPGAAATGHPASPVGYDPGALVRKFVTRPDLMPPAVTVTTAAGAASTPPYIFVSAKGYPSDGPGQPGNMILDRRGRIVWFSPSGSASRLGFTTQAYRGKPVLTWWQGKVTEGHGAGEGVIADASYRTIATVRAGHGLMADLHEFAITPHGTALVTAYQTAAADLTALGGSRNGYVLGCHAQEIDIATGAVLFQWNSLDHVPPAETVLPLKGGTRDHPFDYFHINSLAVAPDGGLLISSRNTSTVYKVSRQTGAVAWRLGGRKSSFRMGPGSRFHFQHHVRPHGPGLLSIFDDGGGPPRAESQSRAILLDLDTTAMKARLRQAFVHPAAVAADNQGSVQLLPDGRVFVGWGNQPYFSEFAPDGRLRLDGEFPVGDQSYRAFTAAWTGTPPDRPRIAAHRNPAGGAIVSVSWNGSTEVATWVVRAGATPGSLTTVGRQAWSGFETPVAVSSTGPYFAVRAYDAGGTMLAESTTVRVQRA